MSSIPYNYGSYIDAKVAMTDTGHVSAGKQIQSPASAGSRGLAKTTQFTNDRTQMQMGNSPIAESMVEIRNILNRIDGVNAPVQEDAGEKIANMAQNMTKDQFMSHADDLGLTPEEAAEHYEKMQGGAHVQEDDMRDMTISDLEAQLGKINDEITFLQIDQKDKESALAALGELRSVLDKYQSQKESAVEEDAGDEAMAKEIAELYDNVLEWITDTENAETDDEAEYGDGYTDTDYNDATDLAKTFREKGMQAGLKLHKELLAKRKGDGFSSFSEWDPLSPETELNYAAKKILARQKESADSGELSRLKELSGMEAPKESEETVSEDIGDKGRIALEKAGFDPMKVKEYMAVFNDHGDTSDIDQMNMDKVGLADAMAMVLASHDVENESYQPMPEGDEFDIEEDEDFEEVLGPLGFPEDETELFDAEYQGRKVPLNKPMRGDTKKFKVYVKDPKTGNVKKVNFGHGGTSANRPTMRIRKSNPKARKSFRARHNCANPGPKTKARYWSCRKW